MSYRRSSRSKGSALRGAKRTTSASSSDDPDPDGTIVGTEEHPFWSVSRGDWIPMEQLVVGERLMLADGSEGVISARDIEYAVAGRATMGTPLNKAGFFTVYNFRVADWHTYHVSEYSDDIAVWVHNADYLDVDDIHLTQSTISDTFSTGETLTQTIRELKNGKPASSLP